MAKSKDTSNVTPLRPVAEPEAPARRSRKRPSNSAISAALMQAKGNFAAAATILGRSRATLYRWVADDEELRQARETAHNIAIEGLKASLWSRAEEGDVGAAKFLISIHEAAQRRQAYDPRTPEDIASDAQLAGC